MTPTIARTLCRLLLGIALAVPSLGSSQAEEPLPTAEVAAELAELGPKITPFSVRYDASLKAVVFNEPLRDADGRERPEKGELQARLDRMDIKRMHYELSSGPFSVAVGTQTIAGRIVFFCREAERCVRRGTRPEGATGEIGEETTEETFAVDIVQEATLDQLVRFTALIRHLITVTTEKKE